MSSKCNLLFAVTYSLFRKYYLLSSILYLIHISVDYGNGSDIDDVADAGVEVCEVNRLVETHLDRTNHFSLR